MNTDIFINKRILFYGPAQTLDKQYINVNNYDYVIITNNLITLFFDKYKLNQQCKIIHLSNHLYTLNYIENLKRNEKKIELFLFIDIPSFNNAKKYIACEKLFLLPSNYNVITKKIPLCLPRILNFLEKSNFKELYITGCTFYKENKIEDCYEENYMVKEGKKHNVFSNDSKKHDIQDNINYVKDICENNKNIILCKELQQRLYE